MTINIQKMAFLLQILHLNIHNYTVQMMTIYVKSMAFLLQKWKNNLTGHKLSNDYNIY